MGPKVFTAKSVTASVLFVLLTVFLLGMSVPAWTAAPAAGKVARPAKPAASAPASPAKNPVKPGKPAQRVVSGTVPNDYYTVTPCRVLDTRQPGALGDGGIFTGGSNATNPRRLMVGGRCGVPASAKVVVLNVAVTNFSTSGYVLLYPGLTPPADAAGDFAFSSIPAPAKSDFLQAALLAADGSLGIQVTIPTGSTLHLVIDINGYYDVAGPVMVAGGGSPTFTEDGAPVVVDPGVTVTDVASPTLSSATVTITNLLDAGAETLAANTAGTAITATYAAPTLTLSGVDTLANYQQVLQSVTYSNSSQNPTTTPRTVSFAANDGVTNSNTVNTTVNITAVNDAPVVTTTGGTTSFTEAGGPVTVDSGITVTDVDNANLASATVTITNLLDSGAETLAANTAGTSITAVYAAPTLTLTGSDTVAHYQQVLASVTYDNSSQNPTTTTRSISFVANDGTANSNTATKPVTITAVNDAPVVTTTGGVTSFTEAGGAVVVDGGVTVTDADSTNLASATVTITNLLDAGSETLAANTAGTSIAAVYAAPTLTLTGSDTVAHYQQVLRSVTYNNTSQNPTTTSRVLAFVANDGTSNSNTALKTVSVTAVNNAPVVTTTGGTTSFTEAGGAVTVDAGVTVTDVDNTNLASAAVTITNLLDSGSEVLAATTTGTSITAVYAAPTLTLTGSDTVAHYQQVLRSVTYNNTSQNPTTTTRSISFVANDGTANSTPATKPVSITAVNNPPVVTTTGGASSFTEGGGAVVVDAGVTVTDVDNANLASATVTISNLLDAGSEFLATSTAGTSITAVYAAPTLTLTGSDTLAHYQQVLRNVTYNNTSQNPSTTARSISFVANDGTANSTPALKSVAITAVNQAPVVTTTGGVTAFTEGGGAVVVDAGVTVTDVDNANLASATVTITNLLDSGAEFLAASTGGTSIVAVYAAPTLTLTGSDTLAHYQQVLRSVTYNNTSQNPTTTTRSIAFVANDGTANSNTGLKSVSVTAVNNAPVVTTTGGATSFTEDGGAVTVDAGVTVTDPDSPSLASATVTITNLLDAGAEFLAATTAGTSITAVYAAPTLTLTGSDSQAHYQQVLQSVTYNNTSQNPNGTTRVVSFVANDGALNSAAATKNVTVTPVDDAPVLTAGGGSPTFTEGGAAVAVDPGITVTDVDNANLASATVTITNVQDTGFETLAATTAGTSIVASYTAPTLTLSGSDTLAHYQQVLRSVTYNNTQINPNITDRVIAFVDNDGTLNSNTANTTVHVVRSPHPPVLTSGGGTTTFTEDGGPVPVEPLMTVVDVDSPNLASATVTITNLLDTGLETLAATTAGTSITASYVAPTLSLTGSDTVAHYQQVLRSVTYNNASQNPNTTARTISFIANDGGLNSNTLNRSVTVVAVNDPPTLTAGGTLNYTENQVATAIDTTITVTDPDSANLVSAAVVITGNFASGQDVLGFTNQNGITGGYNAGTGVLTLSGSSSLANYQTALRSVTYFNSSDNPSGSPRTISWQVDDGAAANHASNIASSTVNVTPVNDPPSITNPTISYTTPGNTQLHVAGATIPGVASWSDAQSVVAKAGPFTDPDGPVAPAIVAASGSTVKGGSYQLFTDGSFTYVPPAGFTGIGVANNDSFTYQVTDTQASTTGTVRIDVGVPVWYIRDVVDSNNPAGGDGRSNNAFDTITAFNAATTNNGDIIFIFEGNTATTPLAGAITLKDGQKLWGQGIDLNVPSFGTPLVTATNKPHIRTTTASTDVVTVPATAGSRNNVEIRGLDLEATGATSNAITVNATGANAVIITISDDNVRGATGKGINLTASTMGTYTATVQNDTITATGIGVSTTTNANGTVAVISSTNTISSAANAFDARTAAGAGQLVLSVHDNTVQSGASGIVIDGSVAGTTTITGFANNAVSGNTVGSGILVTSAKFDAVPGGSFDQVSGGATVIGASGNGVGASGIVLTNVSGDLGFTDLDIFADGGAGLRASGTTAYTGSAGFRIGFPGVISPVATVTAVGGPAIDFSTVAMNNQIWQLVSSTNSATTGAAFNSVTGTFSAPSGSSISGSSGTGFQVGSSNATISYAGTINTTAGKGVDLTSNTGSTISFTGTLTLSAGANTAFNATGGGTVTATDTSSTLTTTTGTALNVANTTIGASGLKFKSISAGTAASGPANGIVLNTTGASGGLTILGTGAQPSGGTIQHTTAAGISLTSTKGPSFNNMKIQTTGKSGVSGSSVTDFTFTNGLIDSSGTAAAPVDDRSNIGFGFQSAGTENNVSGVVTITGNTLTNAFEHGIDIQNFAGTISNATITGNTLTSSTSSGSSLGSGIRLLGFGSASGTSNITKATISNNTVTNFPGGSGITAQYGNSSGAGGSWGTPNSATNIILIQTNQIHGQSAANPMGANAVLATLFGSGQAAWKIDNNNISNTAGTEIGVNVEGANPVATCDVTNNVIAGIVSVGAQAISYGATFNTLSTDAPQLSGKITGNTVTGQDGNGLIVLAGSNSNASVSATITGNSFAAPNCGGCNRFGVLLDSGSATATVAGVHPSLCVNISGNTAAGSGVDSGIGLTQRRSDYVFNIQGLSGTSASAAASWVDSQNPSGGGPTIVVAGSVFGSCTAP
ncbi:MAG TPA: Ig-like domain-containing protein [Thermoanaerobaculia bacterium]|nr:Ig-like domain-containing protein [Thermoanaerobaculia bacterium]